MFPLMPRSKNSTPKVITGYCIITLRNAFGYTIAVRHSLSLIYRIAQNGVGGKHWRNGRNSPIFYPAKLQIQ